jgi:uncharacterized protein YjbJ (UPF0337 family)
VARVGHARARARAAKRATTGVPRRARGSLRQGLGQLTKNGRLDADGKGERLRGKAERAG